MVGVTSRAQVFFCEKAEQTLAELGSRYVNALPPDEPAQQAAYRYCAVTWPGCRWWARKVDCLEPSPMTRRWRWFYRKIFAPKYRGFTHESGVSRRAGRPGTDREGESAGRNQARSQARSRRGVLPVAAHYSGAVQVLNGALLPIVLVFILLLANDARLMGRLRNNRLQSRSKGPDLTLLAGS